MESYARAARKFAADLAGLGAREAALSKRSSFVIVLGDDASLPRPVLDRLRAAGAPFVSHVLLGADDVDRVIIGPDYHFNENDGFRETIAALDARRAPLRDRAPSVIWRGSSTGAPSAAFQEENAKTSTDVSKTKLLNAAPGAGRAAGCGNAMDRCRPVRVRAELRQRARARRATTPQPAPISRASARLGRPPGRARGRRQATAVGARPARQRAGPNITLRVGAWI